MSAMTSEITGVSIVCLTVCPGTDQRNHQSSASLAFVRGIHRSPVDSSHKGLVMRKMFQFDHHGASEAILDYIGKYNQYHNEIMQIWANEIQKDLLYIATAFKTGKYAHQPDVKVLKSMKLVVMIKRARQMRTNPFAFACRTAEYITTKSRAPSQYKDHLSQVWRFSC